MRHRWKNFRARERKTARLTETRVCMRPAHQPGRFADPIGLSEGELRTARCLIDEYLISRRKHASSAMHETRNGFAPDFRKTDLARSLAWYFKYERGFFSHARSRRALTRARKWLVSFIP